jgi:hypothetical protein
MGDLRLMRTHRAGTLQQATRKREYTHSEVESALNESHGSLASWKLWDETAATSSATLGSRPRLSAKLDER